MVLADISHRRVSDCGVYGGVVTALSIKNGEQAEDLLRWLEEFWFEEMCARPKRRSKK